MEALTSHKSEEPREARKSTDKVFDAIYKFYFNKKTTYELTPEEEAIRVRWDFAWKALNQMLTRRQVVSALMQTYNVTHVQAYNDVNKCMMLFGDPRNANKDAKRAIAEDWIVKGIKKAWDDKDLDAYERLLARYSKLNRLEEDNDETLGEMLKKLKPQQIIIVANQKDLEAEANRLQEELTQDVEFKEATE